MQERMKTPAMIIPEAMEAIQGLIKATYRGGLPRKTLALSHLRASQINGCSACVDAGAADARKAGETEQRLATVAAWRDAPYFTEAGPPACPLTEAKTPRPAPPPPVSKELWDQAPRHYDERALASLLLSIA